MLSELDQTLPPVLVHRPTMQVIDGAHRILAARQRGETSIVARLMDGDLEDAFVLGVRTNTAHGKPLTPAERKRAAERILRSRPGWSDRAIAEICGLSGKTVGALRARATEEIPQSDRRVGRDGRSRPVRAEDGRQRVTEVLAQRPDASLREVAAAAGVSPGTVRDVKDRPRQGAIPASPRLPVGPPPAPTTSSGESSGPSASPAPPPGRAALPSDLVEDRALASMPGGESFLSWMRVHAITRADWAPYIDHVPASRLYVVAEQARRCAMAWKEFADNLEARVAGSSR